MNYYNNRQRVVPTNTLLSQDEIIKLQGSNKESFNVSEEELKKTNCVHRYVDGNMAISEPDADGCVTCSICGTKFQLMALQETDKINELVSNIIGLTETIKMYYLDIPNTLQGFFGFTAILKKLPSLARNSINSFFNRVNVMDNNANQRNYYGGNMHNQYRNYGHYDPYFSTPSYQNRYDNYQQPPMNNGYNEPYSVQPSYGYNSPYQQEPYNYGLLYGEPHNNHNYYNQDQYMNNTQVNNQQISVNKITGEQTQTTSGNNGNPNENYFKQ